MSRTSLVMLLTAQALACGSTTCPSNPCPEEVLTVTLEHTWEAGFHEIELDIDGAPYACTMTLPAQNVDLQYCGGDGRVRVGFGDDGNPADVTIEGAETAVVALIVRLDDVAVYDGPVPFTWDKDYPNGPGCPPACYSGATSVAF